MISKRNYKKRRYFVGFLENIYAAFCFKTIIHLTGRGQYLPIRIPGSLKAATSDVLLEGELGMTWIPDFTFLYSENLAL